VIDNEYVTGDGGNHNLVNQDEALILNRCNDMPAVPVGYQEDDSYVVGVFRRSDDVAGS